VTLLLSARNLERLLDISPTIDVVAEAFSAYSSGRTVTPLRLGVEPPNVDGVLLAMPSAVAEPAALGTKVVSVYRGNAQRGLPTISSLYVLSEYDTGRPLAVMDGSYLTGLRTAAGSAVATRLLARPDATRLGVFGTGVQAHFHVLTIARVRPLTEVLVAATSPTKAIAFADWVSARTGIGARPATVAEVSAADIVAACTTSSTPVVDAPSVQPGAHLNAVGSFTPAARELPAALLGEARVYVDTRAGALSEAGDLLLAAREGRWRPEDVAGELGELLLGETEGRTHARQITVYKSVGAAFLDAATARLAYERALAGGVGQTFVFAEP
jgi:ornithine cyclodeaminase/alanine dehydrogenase-like protein (mu-crystallin family)